MTLEKLSEKNCDKCGFPLDNIFHIWKTTKETSIPFSICKKTQNTSNLVDNSTSSNEKKVNDAMQFFPLNILKNNSYLKHVLRARIPYHQMPQVFWSDKDEYFFVRYEDQTFNVEKYDTNNGNNNKMMIVSGKKIINDVKQNISDNLENELISVKILNVSKENDGYLIKIDINGNIYCTYKNDVCLNVTKIYPKFESINNDLSHIVEAKESNLFLKEVKSGEIKSITSDGEEKKSYFPPNPYPTTHPHRPLPILWSPNNDKLLYMKVNSSKINYRKLLNYTDPDEKIIMYPQPYRNEGKFEYTLHIYDVANKTAIDVDLDGLTYDLYSPFESHIHTVNWDEDNELIYGLFTSPNYKSLTLMEINSSNGKTRKILDIHSKNFLTTSVWLEIQNFKVIREQNMVLIVHNETDNHHIYAYNYINGEIMTQITKGDYNVANIPYIDKNKKKIFFTAIGTNKSNPYQLRAFSINFDGSDLQQLFNDDCYQDVSSFSKNGEYCIRKLSDINVPPKIDVVNLNNNKSSPLLKFDTEIFDKIGHSDFELFSVKIQDKNEKIYGYLVKPLNFDKNKKYPIINYIYHGPQYYLNFSDFMIGKLNISGALQSIHMDCVLMMIDGRGTAGRNNKFLFDESGIANTEQGLHDHVYFIEQMCKRFNWLNRDRIGIWGNSFGGYSATRSMLLFPDFYKVGISSAGPQEFDQGTSNFVVPYWGDGNTQPNENVSNLNIAKNLKGKLMLIHGELDECVTIAHSYRMVNELIKHEKLCDLFIIPNGAHNNREKPIYYRKVWEFFLRNL